MRSIHESETTCEGLEPPCRNKRRWISDPEHLPILPTRHKTVDIEIKPMSQESESDMLSQSRCDRIRTCIPLIRADGFGDRCISIMLHTHERYYASL